MLLFQNPGNIASRKPILSGIIIYTAENNRGFDLVLKIGYDKIGLGIIINGDYRIRLQFLV